MKRTRRGATLANATRSDARQRIVPFVLLNCSTSESLRDAAPNASDAGAASVAEDTLPCIAPAIIANCAVGGCHDAETREHGMDLRGQTCGEPLWQCVSHFDGENSGDAGAGGAREVLAHPCPEEVVEYCGCDGVTFEALLTCPDRPYDHAGPCGDGYNCDVFDSKCGDSAPACDGGHAPAVVNDCFADCVPLADCRCEYDWECPEPNVCNLEERRCAPAPAEILRYW